MKKYFIILVSIFLCVLSFNVIKIYAEEDNNVLGKDRIPAADILYGMNINELRDSNFKEEINDLENLNIISSGILSSSLEFRAYRFGHDLITSLTFSNGKVINYSASYNNVIFYDIDFINNDFKIKKEIPVAIKTIYGDTVSCQDITGYTDYSNITYNTGYDKDDFKGNYNLINNILFSHIHYQLEEEKLLNINVSSNSAPSIQILLENIFDNFYIEANNYLPYNDEIASDTYKATIFSYENNKYIKYNMSINAINKTLSSPLIKVNKDEELSLDNIKNIIEESNNITLSYFEVITNRYSDYKNVLGSYTNIYLIKDNNNIYYLLEVNIEVYEKTPIDDNTDSPITTTTNKQTPSSTITGSKTNPTTTGTKTNPNPKTTTSKVSPSSNTSTTNPTTIPDNPNQKEDIINNDILDILTEEIKVSYKDNVKIDDLLNEIIIDSTNEIKDISYDTDYKFDDTIGTYYLIINLKDNKDNVTEKEIELIIYDDIKPVLVIPSFITNTKEALKLSEIQNKILAVDEVDGEISSKNIKLTDIDNYQVNYNKSGSYEIIAKVSDKSGNEAKASFLITVKDSKEYNSYLEDNTINITNTNKITKRDFISYLSKNNYITNSNITLESTYFNVDNPDGEYELTIKSKTDEKTFNINVYNGLVNKNITIKEEDNNNYKLYYIIIGSATGFILIITILSIIIYRKKRNKE